MDPSAMSLAIMEDGIEAALYNYIYYARTRATAEMVCMLIEAGADVNYTGPLEKTPLHEYMHNHHPKDVRVVQALLRAGAFVDLSERCCGATPLHLCMRMGFVDLRLLRMLLGGRRLVSTSVFNTQFMSSLLREYMLHRDSRPCDEGVVQFLMRYGANVNDNGGVGRSILHACASICPTRSLLRTLLRFGANVNARDLYGSTPLGVLVRSASATLDLMDVLVDAGADVRALDDRGNTMLHQHAQSRRPRARVVQRLLELGCDHRSQNADGNTPLHVMAMQTSCKCSIIRLLLEAGANVDAPNAHSDRTPLHMAASYGNSRACMRLLSLGADAFRRSAMGQTPLACMVSGDLVECTTRVLVGRPQALDVAASLAVAENRSGRSVRKCVAYVVARAGASALPVDVLEAHAAYVRECEEEVARMRGILVGDPAMSLLDIMCSQETPPTVLCRRAAARALQQLRLYRESMRVRLQHMRHRTDLVARLANAIGPCSMPADVISLVLLRVPTSQLRQSCGLSGDFSMR
ncbi:putative ankyrin repeat protein [Parapoxvirus red deer/HL953]|uniref:Putative ankyrin repeat protein n=1 Tax=Parapoxvirus red deer/HL953 TaxID=1579460 RepID=A0A0A7M9L4_9POXV|nr:putative ankyrin repeat protein [Parapoxvirus red deer/HL953]AIZ77255.1 putative ankyrin repeat protein [Parapoxvirus red deer/HL953]